MEIWIPGQVHLQTCSQKEVHICFLPFARSKLRLFCLLVLCVVPNKYPYFLDWMTGIEEVVVYKTDTEGRAARAVEEADLIFCGRCHEAAVSVGKGCGLCAVPVRGNQPRNSAGRVHRPDGDRAGGRQVQHNLIKIYDSFANTQY